MIKYEQTNIEKIPSVDSRTANPRVTGYNHPEFLHLIGANEMGTGFCLVLTSVADPVELGRGVHRSIDLGET